MAEAISAAIPGSRLVRIPRAGHTSSVEYPEAVNAALDAFLAELAQPGRAAGARGAGDPGSPASPRPSGDRA
jgi:hypothetical protein